MSNDAVQSALERLELELRKTAVHLQSLEQRVQDMERVNAQDLAADKRLEDAQVKPSADSLGPWKP